MMRAALLLLGTTGAAAQCSSYMDINNAVTAVNTACGASGVGGPSFAFPPSCSANCAATFVPWFGGGTGACFLALGLSPQQAQQFASFGSLCSTAGGGGGAGGTCPVCPSCAGIENRYVLVDQPMTWAQADAYCTSNYRSLASIHSADENELAVAACETSTSLNPCVDRFVDAATCVGAEGW